LAIFSTFNPSAMPPELIEGTFVQRESVADRLVDVFEESARRVSKHNALLVGPRGIGKSHLVSLVYHRLKAKKDLDDKLCIAYLKEDEWGITSFLDLLLRILRAASEDSGRQLPSGVSDLSKLSRSQAEDHVWRSLQEMLGTRTLLVIVENLDAVFEKIGEQGQRQWRALIQTYPQWAILATTPALFSAISRQVSPFYGFFEVIHLEPLSFNDAIALLKRLARLNNDEKTAALLDTPVGRARVRAVQHIAGGNHRIFVLFYDFLSQSEPDQFVEPLLKTIDALTPYYQSHMTRLSPQQQKIVNFLCEHWKPATVTTIAANCMTTHQTAASQLRQLLTDRYVRVDRFGREAFYELTEPLLRICVEAKTHRERPLHLLVDFIRYWFSREELEHILFDAGDRNPGRSYFLAALKEYDTSDAHAHLNPEIAALCSTLSLNKGTQEQMRTQAQELEVISKIAEDWSHYTRALTWLDRGEEAIPILEKQLEQHPDNVEILRDLACALGTSGSTERAERLLDRAISLSPDSGVLFIAKGDLLADTERGQEALEAYDSASHFAKGISPIIAVQKARVLIRLERFKEAREALDPFLTQGQTVLGIFSLYGAALGREGNLDDEALEYFDKATNAFENDAVSWGNKGISLCKLERYREAIEAFNNSLALNPGDEDFAQLRCEALLETKQYAMAAGTAPAEALSHNIFHQLLKIANDRPRQGKLQQLLLDLKDADNSSAWRNAFIGGLTEFTSCLAGQPKPRDTEELPIWNAALHELFSTEEKFSILLKLFEVLTRLRVFDDKKALLELPREQRLLLIGKDEASLGTGKGQA
jgi:tetratricopeptide (TPR) repeat protein